MLTELVQATLQDFPLKGFADIVKKNGNFISF